MKKIIAMLLLLSLALTATVSNSNPKEGELVTFETTFNTTINETVTFEWDLDFNLYSPTCINNTSDTTCTVQVPIPLDSLDLEVDFEFNGYKLGLIDSGTIYTQDMHITATTPPKVNIDTSFSVPIEVLWEDGSITPDQTITINSTELSIYNLFLAGGYFSKNINIPLVDSGLYDIDFTLVHGSTIKTITKTIEVFGRTTGAITPKQINVLPTAFSTTKEFPVEVEGTNTGSSAMSNAKLSITSFGSTKSYTCGIMAPGTNCVNQFTLILPANKQSGLYTMQVKLEWTNDDGTNDAFTTNYNLVVDELFDLELDLEDLGDLDPDKEYKQNITLTSLSNTPMDIEFELIDLNGTLSKENVTLAVNEVKNITLTFSTGLLEETIDGKLKVTGDFPHEYEIEHTINNYEFDIFIPDVDWLADTSLYDFNIVVKNLNDVDVLGNISAVCPNGWICNFVNNELNITANQNISVPFSVGFDEITDQDYEIDFILDFKTVNITETMDINFALANISYEPFKSYTIQNASRDYYYFLSGNDLVPKSDLNMFDGVTPIGVRDYLDTAWTVHLQNTTNVPSTCLVYVLTDEDSTPFLLTEKYPQGLAGGYNAKAYLAVKFQKISDSACTFYLKWGDGKQVKYSVTVFEVTQSAEEEILTTVKNSVDDLIEKDEESDEQFELIMWIVIGVVGLGVGVKLYQKYQTRGVSPINQNRNIITRKQYGKQYEPQPKKPLISLKEKVNKGINKLTGTSRLDYKDQSKYNSPAERKLFEDHKEFRKKWKELDG